MKHTGSTTIFALVVTLLYGVSLSHTLGGACIELDTLDQEVEDLYRAGKDDRAVVVAQKALQVAEQNAGPDHTDVASSLENPAAMFRSTELIREAESLERRAANIRAFDLSPEVYERSVAKIVACMTREGAILREADA